MSVIDKFDMSGKVALVTGATRGLGREFALALAEAGADVIVHGRDAEAASQVKRSIESAGRRAFVVLGDVKTARSAQGLVADGISQAGRIDVLVNNAGACIHRPALEVTAEEWSHVMDTNLSGLWFVSQSVGRHMTERGSGVIVNVGSMSGLIVNRPQMQPAYNASKAAVHHLTKSLAAEWAPLGVRVNAIAPGYIETDMSPVDDPQFRQHWIEDAPQQRFGTPGELGAAMVFLASEASSFMTGSVIVIDGGYTVF